MGIWLERLIDRKKSGIGYTKSVPLSNVRKNLDNGSKAGVLSSPYTLSPLHIQSLYTKNDICLIVDGEIENFQNIASVIDLYLKQGIDALWKLDGSFSLILHDFRKQATLLFRPLLSSYPLYYVKKNNLLSVSTNPVYLLHRSDISNSLDSDEMSLLFTLNISQWNGRVFSEIAKVEQGQICIVTAAGIKRSKVRLDDIVAKALYGSDSEVIERYSYRMQKAIEKAIETDRKYGIMLSSGMDSSALAAYASSLLQRKGSSLTAYSWTLSSIPQSDESEKIKELCSMLGIELKIFEGEYFGPFDSLDKMQMMPDMPFLNPFWPIIDELYRIASLDDIDALLNGGYADTLFASSSTLLLDIVGDRRFELLLPTLKMIFSGKAYSDVLKHSPSIHGLLRKMFPFRRAAQRHYRAPEWLSSDAKKHREKVEEDIRKHKRLRYKTALSPFQGNYLGIERYLSGHYGIKRTEPHRDPELVSYMLNMPTYMIYRDGQTKYVAREAMRGLLPESIRMQPRVGLLDSFVENSYLRNRKKIREMLLDEREPWKVYIDEKWMETQLKKETDIQNSDLLVIWMSLNIGLWQKAIKPGGALYEGSFMKSKINR